MRGGDFLCIFPVRRSKLTGFYIKANHAFTNISLFPSFYGEERKVGVKIPGKPTNSVPFTITSKIN